MIARLVLVIGMGVVAFTGCSLDRDRGEPVPVAGIHPAGILDPASDQFHGKEVARRGWDLNVCAACHGADFSGGTSHVSCVGCHVGGPTACKTCHGDGPTTGAHALHRTSAVACAECHIVPATWDAEGHVRLAGLADPPPAEVVFGARAAITIVPADRAGPPTFDGVTCTNIYCHGDALGAAGGRATQPRWDATPRGGCDECHGAPPPSHAQDHCASCHPSDAPHIDGIVQVGRTAGCDGCHGTAASPAPPVDLEGNTVTTALGVGAHQAHLLVPTGLRPPIPCETCHVVPTALHSPGHIDSPLPAEVSVALGWNRTTETCETAFCHGPARPRWTDATTVTCGSCHGVPPTTPSHTPDMTIASCANCHPVGPVHHMDGVLDVF